MASNLMVNGWEIGFSRDVLVAELELAGESDMAFNVDFASSAARVRPSFLRPMGNSLPLKPIYG